VIDASEQWISAVQKEEKKYKSAVKNEPTTKQKVEAIKSVLKPIKK